MSESFPAVVNAHGTLSIYFSDSIATRSVEIACVVDLTDFDDVIGVEILKWGGQLSGGRIDVPSPSGQFRWSYDNEMDALYIHVKLGRGQIQKRSAGTVSLDSDQRVLNLEIPLSPTSDG